MTPPTPAAMPAHRPPPPTPKPDLVYDPQVSNAYWNRQCPADGCTTVIPRHRTGCVVHEERP